MTVTMIAERIFFSLANEDSFLNLGLKGGWTISIRLLKLLSR